MNVRRDPISLGETASLNSSQYYQYTEFGGGAVHTHLLVGSDPHSLKFAGDGENTHLGCNQHCTFSSFLLLSPTETALRILSRNK